MTAGAEPFSAETLRPPIVRRSFGQDDHVEGERDAVAAFYAGPDPPPCDEAADDWAEVEDWIAGFNRAGWAKAEP